MCKYFINMTMSNNNNGNNTSSNKNKNKNTSSSSSSKRNLFFTSSSSSSSSSFCITANVTANLFTSITAMLTILILVVMLSISSSSSSLSTSSSLFVSGTATNELTQSKTLHGTLTSSKTYSIKATASKTSSNTKVPTNTKTPTESSTQFETLSNSATRTVTDTASVSSTKSRSQEETDTKTSTLTNTVTHSPSKNTVTLSQEETESKTSTRSETPTHSPSKNTVTLSQEESETKTSTPSPTKNTITRSQEETATRTTTRSSSKNTATPSQEQTLTKTGETETLTRHRNSKTISVSESLSKTIEETSSPSRTLTDIPTPSASSTFSSTIEATPTETHLDTASETKSLAPTQSSTLTESATIEETQTNTEPTPSATLSQSLSDSLSRELIDFYVNISNFTSIVGLNPQNATSQRYLPVDIWARSCSSGWESGWSQTAKAVCRLAGFEMFPLWRARFFKQIDTPSVVSFDGAGVNTRYVDFGGFQCPDGDLTPYIGTQTCGFQPSGENCTTASNLNTRSPWASFCYSDPAKFVWKQDIDGTVLLNPDESVFGSDYSGYMCADNALTLLVDTVRQSICNIMAAPLNGNGQYSNVAPFATGLSARQTVAFQGDYVLNLFQCSVRDGTTTNSGDFATIMTTNRCSYQQNTPKIQSHFCQSTYAVGINCKTPPANFQFATPEIDRSLGDPSLEKFSITNSTSPRADNFGFTERLVLARLNNQESNPWGVVCPRAGMTNDTAIFLCRQSGNTKTVRAYYSKVNATRYVLSFLNTTYQENLATPIDFSASVNFDSVKNGAVNPASITSPWINHTSMGLGSTGNISSTYLPIVLSELANCVWHGDDLFDCDDTFIQSTQWLPRNSTCNPDGQDATDDTFVMSLVCIEEDLTDSAFEIALNLTNGAVLVNETTDGGNTSLSNGWGTLCQSTDPSFATTADLGGAVLCSLMKWPGNIVESAVYAIPNYDPITSVVVAADVHCVNVNRFPDRFTDTVNYLDATFQQYCVFENETAARERHDSSCPRLGVNCFLEKINGWYFDQSPLSGTVLLRPQFAATDVFSNPWGSMVVDQTLSASEKIDMAWLVCRLLGWGWDLTTDATWKNYRTHNTSQPQADYEFGRTTSVRYDNSTVFWAELRETPYPTRNSVNVDNWDDLYWIEGANGEMFQRNSRTLHPLDLAMDCYRDPSHWTFAQDALTGLLTVQYPDRYNPGQTFTRTSGTGTMCVSTDLESDSNTQFMFCRQLGYIEPAEASFNTRGDYTWPEVLLDNAPANRESNAGPILLSNMTSCPATATDIGQCNFYLESLPRSGITRNLCSRQDDIVIERCHQLRTTWEAKQEPVSNLVILRPTSSSEYGSISNGSLVLLKAAVANGVYSSLDSAIDQHTHTMQEDSSGVKASVCKLLGWPARISDRTSIEFLTLYSKKSFEIRAVMDRPVYFSNMNCTLRSRSDNNLFDCNYTESSPTSDRSGVFVGNMNKNNGAAPPASPGALVADANLTRSYTETEETSSLSQSHSETDLFNELNNVYRMFAKCKTEAEDFEWRINMTYGGRLEVRPTNQHSWGTVCNKGPWEDDVALTYSMPQETAVALCRMASMREATWAKIIKPTNVPTNDPSTIYLQNLNCTTTLGQESYSLENCVDSYIQDDYNLNRTTCTHDDDVALLCFTSNETLTQDYSPVVDTASIQENNNITYWQFSVQTAALSSDTRFVFTKPNRTATDGLVCSNSDSTLHAQNDQTLCNFLNFPGTLTESTFSRTGTYAASPSKQIYISDIDCSTSTDQSTIARPSLENCTSYLQSDTHVQYHTINRNDCESNSIVYGSCKSEPSNFRFRLRHQGDPLELTANADLDAEYGYLSLSSAASTTADNLISLCYNLGWANPVSYTADIGSSLTVNETNAVLLRNMECAFPQTSTDHWYDSQSVSSFTSRTRGIYPTCTYEQYTSRVTPPTSFNAATTLVQNLTCHSNISNWEVRIDAATQVVYVRPSPSSRWGTVCFNDMNIEAASTLCHHTGIRYIDSIAFEKVDLSSTLSFPSTPQYLGGLRCANNATFRLDDGVRCQYQEASEETLLMPYLGCSHKTDTKIICVPRPSRTSSQSRTFTASSSETSSQSTSETQSLEPTPSKSESSSQTVTATDSLEPTASKSFTATRTESSTLEETPTRSLEPTPTHTETATSTESSSASRSKSPSQSISATETEEPTASKSSTVTLTGTSSLEPTPTVSDEATPTLTDSTSKVPTPSKTHEMTDTQTFTESQTASKSLEPTATESHEATTTLTSSSTLSATDTLEPTATSTLSATSTETESETEKLTASQSHEETPSRSSTRTASVSESSSVSKSVSRSRSESSTATETLEATATSSLEPTSTDTLSDSNTASKSETYHHRGSFTEHATETRTLTETETYHYRGSFTKHASETETQEATPSSSSSESKTVTASRSASESASTSVSDSASASSSKTVSSSSTLTESVPETESKTLLATDTETEEATASRTASLTDSQTPSKTASATASASESESSSATDTEIATESKTITESETYHHRGSVTKHASETETQETTPSSTSSVSESETPSHTASSSVTSSKSESQSATDTDIATESKTITDSETYHHRGSFTKHASETETQEATPSSSSSASESATPSPTASSSPTASRSESKSATDTEIATESKTITESETYHHRGSFTKHASETETQEATPSSSSSVSESETPSPTASSSATSSKSQSQSATDTQIATESKTITESETYHHRGSFTKHASETETQEATPSSSFSESKTVTSSESASESASISVSDSASASASKTVSSSSSLTESVPETESKTLLATDTETEEATASRTASLTDSQTPSKTASQSATASETESQSASDTEIATTSKTLTESETYHHRGSFTKHASETETQGITPSKSIPATETDNLTESTSASQTVSISESVSQSHSVSSSSSTTASVSESASSTASGESPSSSSTHDLTDTYHFRGFSFTDPITESTSISISETPTSSSTQTSSLSETSSPSASVSLSESESDEPTPTKSTSITESLTSRTPQLTVSKSRATETLSKTETDTEEDTASQKATVSKSLPETETKGESASTEHTATKSKELTDTAGPSETRRHTHTQSHAATDSDHDTHTGAHLRTHSGTSTLSASGSDVEQWYIAEEERKKRLLAQQLSAALNAGATVVVALGALFVQPINFAFLSFCATALLASQHHVLRKSTISYYLSPPLEVILDSSLDVSHEVMPSSVAQLQKRFGATVLILLIIFCVHLLVTLGVFFFYFLMMASTHSKSKSQIFTVLKIAAAKTRFPAIYLIFFQMGILLLAFQSGVLLSYDGTNGGNQGCAALVFTLAIFNLFAMNVYFGIWCVETKDRFEKKKKKLEENNSLKRKSLTSSGTSPPAKNPNNNSGNEPTNDDDDDQEMKTQTNLFSKVTPGPTGQTKRFSLSGSLRSISDVDHPANKVIISPVNNGADAIPRAARRVSIDGLSPTPDIDDVLGEPPARPPLVLSPREGSTGSEGRNSPIMPKRRKSVAFSDDTDQASPEQKTADEHQQPPKKSSLSSSEADKERLVALKNVEWIPFFDKWNVVEQRQKARDNNDNDGNNDDIVDTSTLDEKQAVRKNFSWRAKFKNFLLPYGMYFSIKEIDPKIALDKTDEDVAERMALQATFFYRMWWPLFDYILPSKFVWFGWVHFLFAFLICFTAGIDFRNDEETSNNRSTSAVVCLHAVLFVYIAFLRPYRRPAAFITVLLILFFSILLCLGPLIFYKPLPADATGDEILSRREKLFHFSLGIAWFVVVITWLYFFAAIIFWYLENYTNRPWRDQFIEEETIYEHQQLPTFTLKRRKSSVAGGSAFGDKTQFEGSFSFFGRNLGGDDPMEHLGIGAKNHSSHHNKNNDDGFEFRETGAFSSMSELPPMNSSDGAAHDHTTNTFEDSLTRRYLFHNADQNNKNNENNTADRKMTGKMTYESRVLFVIKILEDRLDLSASKADISGFNDRAIAKNMANELEIVRNRTNDLMSRQAQEDEDKELMERLKKCLAESQKAGNNRSVSQETKNEIVSCMKTRLIRISGEYDPNEENNQNLAAFNDDNSGNGKMMSIDKDSLGIDSLLDWRSKPSRMDSDDDDRNNNNNNGKSLSLNELREARRRSSLSLAKPATDRLAESLSRRMSDCHSGHSKRSVAAADSSSGKSSDGPVPLQKEIHYRRKSTVVVVKDDDFVDDFFIDEDEFERNFGFGGAVDEVDGNFVAGGDHLDLASPKMKNNDQSKGGKKTTTFMAPVKSAQDNNSNNHNNKPRRHSILSDSFNSGGLPPIVTVNNKGGLSTYSPTADNKNNKSKNVASSSSASPDKQNNNKPYSVDEDSDFDDIPETRPGHSVLIMSETAARQLQSSLKVHTPVVAAQKAGGKNKTDKTTAAFEFGDDYGGAPSPMLRFVQGPGHQQGKRVSVDSVDTFASADDEGASDSRCNPFHQAVRPGKGDKWWKNMDDVDKWKGWNDI